MNKGGFSWKRATGVTRAKSRISRKTGIPLTRSGRQRKVGRAVTGGGCLAPAFMLGLGLVASAFATACQQSYGPRHQPPPADRLTHFDSASGSGLGPRW
jgi:hypothetical protein